ncbi:MAG: NUDIX domain-containing protein, partial [Cruoricaptor ignavus]|nr:NUDIX domain-containing protein [Cruoricaptor ignavus]
KNPKCEICPLQNDCSAFAIGEISKFPVKTKKVKTEDLALHYYFVKYKNQFLICRRATDFIWKNLYEFPTEIPKIWEKDILNSKIIKHKLTHKNLSIQIDLVALNSEKEFLDFANQQNLQIVNLETANQKSFPKPLENYMNFGVEF